MILFEIKNQVATLTLNRPEKYHSFVREMALNLQAKLDLCKNDNNIRAIVIIMQITMINVFVIIYWGEYSAPPKKYFIPLQLL